MSNDPTTPPANPFEGLIAMTAGTSFFLLALTRTLIKGGQLDPEALQIQVDLTLQSIQSQMNASEYEKTCEFVKTMTKDALTDAKK